MNANQPAFDIGDLLRGLQSQAAYGAAQFGLPQGQNFNYTPPVQGMPQQPQNSNGGLWNALGYAGDVLGAIQRSGDGGWAGDALSTVVQRRNAQSYNQAIQQAKLAEVMAAQQLRQDELADIADVTGRKFRTSTVGMPYMKDVSNPLALGAGQYEQELGQGQDILQAFPQLPTIGFGGTSPTGQPMQQAQPQAQQPAFQAPVNGFAMQNLPPDNQFSASATQNQLPDTSGIRVTPDSLKYYTDVQKDNKTLNETAYKNRQDERLRQLQLKQQREYQQGQLSVQRQRAGTYAQQVSQLGAYQQGQLRNAENKLKQQNPNKYRLLQEAVNTGKMPWPDYLQAISASDPMIDFGDAPPTQPTGGGAPRAGGGGTLSPTAWKQSKGR
jgi:hypothetical protein